MQKKLIQTAVILTGALMPLFALAASDKDMAGTDRYLREVVGLTDEQLSQKTNTLDREAFSLATGEQKIDDPFGDVLTTSGTTSETKFPWGDIKNVEVEKDEAAQAWQVTATFGSAIPEVPPEKAQFIFYADRDADETNNSTTGIRIYVDAEFALEFDPTSKSWVTDFRWYNPDPVDFWAIDKETKMTFAFNSEKIILNIPFEEIPKDIELKWRFVSAVTESGSSEIDAVPGVGFPPPKGETYPVVETMPTGLQLLPITVYIFMVLVALGAGYWIYRSRKQVDS